MAAMTDTVSAENEKRQAALSSVLAAIFLTTFKIIVGVATGSLGILAEAAHSALDLVAALVTFFAVRFSDRPPDEEHPYGHGKIENLSALIETVLLLITSAWITYEAINRLFFEDVEVDASFWAFLVMGVSIFVDYNRSRLLQRAAQKYHSQALEADALHFSTDIWSSSVVIVGLIGVKLAEWFPGLSFLSKADAIAAIVVAIIVIFVSLQLGKRTVQALLDTAPAKLSGEIKAAVEAVPGVVECHHVRVREAGPYLFVDAHVALAGNPPLSEAHDIVLQIEEAIRQIAPRSDVTVHADPETAVTTRLTREKAAEELRHTPD